MAEIRESMQTHAAGVELLGYRYEVGELAANQVEIRISHCGMPLRTYGVSPASRIGVLGIGELGYLALQLARVFGAEVTGAFSQSAVSTKLANVRKGAVRYGAVLPN